MSRWVKSLRVNPIPCLVTANDEALTYLVRRDLLDQAVGPIEELWALPGALKLMNKQGEDGSWRYPGKNRDAFTYTNYDLLETFRNLRLLVETYGFYKSHPAKFQYPFWWSNILTALDSLSLIGFSLSSKGSTPMTAAEQKPLTR